MGDLSRNREPGGDNRSTLVSIIVESDGWRLDTILAKAFPNLKSCSLDAPLDAFPNTAL